jgi:ribonucleotide monophosphatase NagD (HAD superfamily)
LLLLSPSAKEEFAHISTTEKDYDSVILGLDPSSLSYGSLNTAFRVLKHEPISTSPPSTSSSTRKAVSLIAPHAALYHQSSETPDMPAGLNLGIGPFVRALELASGVEAELVGKPTRRFFELAVERLKENTAWKGDIHEVGIVGDDATNDLGDGAKDLGLSRILVRTGKYRVGVEEGEEVDGVYDTFADFVDDLID